MNILVDALPQDVEIDGIKHRINTDFRSCMRIILAFEDGELTPQEKQHVALYNIFCGEIPDNLEAAIGTVVWFLNAGTSQSADFRLYSFQKDQKLIYAAFRQTHSIDLTTAQLHWWQFLALFADLGADTVFCQLVSLRKLVKTGKATKEQRQAARDMGDAFDIPDIDTRDLDERENEAEFMRLIKAGSQHGSRL